MGDTKLRHTKNSLVRADDSLAVVVGLNDVVVVSTPDATLIAHKDYVQDAKVIASELKAEERSEWQLHREVWRPWGKFDSIDRGDGTKSKEDYRQTRCQAESANAPSSSARAPGCGIRRCESDAGDTLRFLST